MTGHELVAARLGGDEFVVMATGVDSREAAGALAQRLVDAAGGRYVVGDSEIALTVSMGVILAGPDSTAEQLLRDADTAMYEAKRQGRGRWVLFEPSMHQKVASALALESDLRQALATESIRAVFQPIVDIATGQIRGLEALARWRHPSRGEVSPIDFIGVAEESGLICALGTLVLERACAALAAWRREGLGRHIRMSVNVSRAQLQDEALPRRIGDILERYGLPADSLQLEVTESMAMETKDLCLVLERLRAVGVRLSIDDFGTGHSSLAALQGLPVQQVKIDRSFVKEIGTSRYHKAVVQAALHVAASLQLDVVAEGVETIEQAASLELLGCPSAQGWLYSKAVEQGQVEELLQRASLLPAPRETDHAPLAEGPNQPDYQVVVTDPQGLTTFVNAAFTRNTGYTIDDMKGRTPGAVLQGPLSSPDAIARLSSAIAARKPIRALEIINYRRDGTPFVALLDIEPVLQDGRLSHFMSIQLEVTNRARARRRLAELRPVFDLTA